MVRNFGEMAITCGFDIYVFGLCRTFKLEMTHEKLRKINYGTESTLPFPCGADY